MKPVLSAALVLACLWAAPVLSAQAKSSSDSGSDQSSGASQSKPSSKTQNSPAAQQPSRVQTQSNSNPFPEDTSSVPIIPTGNVPDLPPDNSASHIPLPSQDADPVRTPEEAGAAAESNENNSSSSLAGMGSLLPPADDNDQPGKRHGKDSVIEPEHHETAKEDENVGEYYLDNKDWKGALSRYESALVLDPDNPDVYWGLAECQRHMGDFADARSNYLKVMEYDPGSHHSKEARKALEDPEIANAASKSH